MIIKNGKVVLADKILECADVKIENGLIVEIGENLSGGEEFDAKNHYVLPGLVDIHTHGGFGGDFMDEDEEDYINALKFHSQNGTTSLLTSSVTAPVKSIEAMIKRTREYMKKTDICRVLGAHIEGPYISYKNKGAQKAEFLRVPEKDDYSFILDNSDVIKNVTISTELPGAVEMTKAMKACGIVVSGGHDDGRSDTVYPCIDAGLSNCTHWYCAMSTARVEEGKRYAGLMEIGLTDDRLTLELLADNHHIIPELLKVAYTCKGADKLCIVSDCLRAGGMPRDGRVYTLGMKDDEEATKFIVSDGVARLTDGTRFAGSIQSLGQMLRNIVGNGIPLVDAVKMASTTPAKIIGMQDKIGSIEAGKYADLYITDEKLNPVKTMINGKFLDKE